VPRPKKGATSDGLTYVGLEDGRFKYEARIRVKHGGKLRERQRMLLGDSIHEIRKKRDELEAQFRAELEIKAQGRDGTVEVLMAKWLETLRHSTRVTYTTYARHFERAFGERRLAAITTQELQAFLASLPLSDQSVNCMRGGYCSFFKWAKKHGHIADNAMLQTERRKTILTDAELLESVQTIPASRAMTHDEVTVFMRTFEQVDPEAYLIFGTQLLLGCRIGEAIALHWSDVDEATGRVIIRHNFSKDRLSVPKSRRARLTALGPRWLKELQAHRARLLAEGRPMADVIVFPAPPSHLERRSTDHHFWYYRGLRQRFCAVLETCGITLAEGVATHAMRHTLVSLVRSESEQVIASRLVGAAAAPSARDDDLRSRVGHSTIALTEHYTSVPGQKLIDLSEEVERRVLGAPKSR
jgi:integrase